MSENLKVSVDLNAGKFDIEGPADEVKALINELSSLFATRRSQRSTSGEPSAMSASPTETGAPARDERELKSEEEPSKARKRGGTGKTKTRNYQIVDLGLDEPARKKLREFVSEKQPSTQNDQVAVIGVFLKQNLGKDRFTVDEIFSGFRVAGFKTPKNLTAVFNNMEKAGIALHDRGEVVINYMTEDYVKFNLPHKSKE